MDCKKKKRRQAKENKNVEMTRDGKYTTDFVCMCMFKNARDQSKVRMHALMCGGPGAQKAISCFRRR